MLLYLQFCLVYSCWLMLLTYHETDSQVRSTFRYRSAPSIILFRYIANICSDLPALIRVCAEACEALSGHLKDGNDPFLVINLMKQVIQTARIKVGSPSMKVNVVVHVPDSC